MDTSKKRFAFWSRCDYKDYRFLENVPQITINKLLKGEIKSFLELSNISKQDYYDLEEKRLNKIDVNQTMYSIIIKYQYDDLVRDEISIVESIIIQ